MVEISKTGTKLIKIIIKYVPFIIAIGYLLMAIFSCFGISCALLPILFRYSFCSFICLLAMSMLLKFCIWHRLPLYYSASIDIINTIDYYIVIPIENKWMLLLYMIITIVFILIGMYLKEKHNAKNRIT